MAQTATGAMGHVDSHVICFIDGVNDERVVVATTLVRFEEAIAKRNGLQDNDASARTKKTRDKTLVEETRLNTARDELVTAKVDLVAYGVAVHGAPSHSEVGASCAKLDDEDALENKELRLLKRKLPAPKDGWRDAKGATIHSYADRHLL